MTEYVPIYERPHCIGAFEAGRKEGSNPKTGRGMTLFFYGRPADDDPDQEKTENMNGAWLTGWFTGSHEWAENHPDPKYVVIDEPLPMQKPKEPVND